MLKYYYRYEESLGFGWEVYYKGIRKDMRREKVPRIRHIMDKSKSHALYREAIKDIKLT